MFITSNENFNIWGIDETNILGQLPDHSFYITDSYTMRNYSDTISYYLLHSFFEFEKT